MTALTVAAFGIVVGYFANANHTDFTPVAFGAAATLLAFLLSGAALVGPYVAEELASSVKYVDSLQTKMLAAEKEVAAAAKENDEAARATTQTALTMATTNFESAKANARSEMLVIFSYAAWLQTGLVCALLSIPVSAVALVISPAVPGQCALDFHAIIGAAAITLLAGTGVGIVPMAWHLMHLKVYRSLVERSFP